MSRKLYEHLKPTSKWKLKLHEIIFEADTPAGKWFDVFLILFIGLSVLFALLDSVESISLSYSRFFIYSEWFFTVLFTIEFIFRLLCVKKPMKYALSFYGFVDFISILPTFLSIITGNIPSLIFIRVLRMLRIFRVFKLGKYVQQAQLISKALKNSFPKITVFLTAVGTLVIIVGSLMHMIEGGENGFTSIPQSIYWTIVTLTTVGYGDISPQTPIGKFLASAVMITGYGIIAVPTGIVSVEIAKSSSKEVSTQACPNCSRENHDVDAEYCKYCGAKLNN